MSFSSRVPVYDSAESLNVGYSNLLKELLVAEPVDSVVDEFSVGSGWGSRVRNFREIINVSFIVDTDDVLLDSTVRPVSIEYALGSSIWMLEGRNDLETMVNLNPRGEMFSMDSFTLSGAFGYRLRTKNGDQIEACIQLLKKDLTSRRAIAFIGDAFDVQNLSNDFPCASSMQFFVRKGKLVSVVTMRSQSVFGVLPYDLVNFRYIHRYVAHGLNLSSGGMVVSCNSAHIYEEEVEKINIFLESDFSFKNPGDIDFSLLTS